MTTAAYKAKIAAIGKEADTAEKQVVAGMQAKSTAALADTLATFAAAEEKMSREVAAIDPPTDAKAANEQLARGLHDIAQATSDALPQVRAAATATAAINALNRSTAGQKAGQEIDQALAQLKKLGYATGG
jgi:hypothetical protein